MTTNKFTRIRAAEDAPPVGAFAVEIPSNEYVTGSLLSKCLYLQTKEENNGGGDMGTSDTGNLNKSASENKYIEKIASMSSWAKGLAKNIKEAEPLTQVGIGLGAVVGAGKAKAGYDNMTNNKHRKTMEEKSLKALQAINRNLNKAVVKPANQ